MPHLQIPPRSLRLAALASLSLSLGCNGTVESAGAMDPNGNAVPPPGGGNPGAGGMGHMPGGGATAAPPGGMTNAAGGTPAGTGATGSTTGGATATACSTPSETTATKRLVRLSFNQIANSIGTLIDSMLGTKVAADNMVVGAEHRTFPPLQNPREGNSVTDATWKTMDAMAQAAGQYVFDNFATVTACGAAPTDECAQQYLSGLAQKAYRRPLTPAEQTRLTTLYTSLKTDAGATINEAVQHGVYAIVQAPQFVYRTEFGLDALVEGALTASELASALSYFLTDDMPDAELLDAAAQNKLASPADIGAQVDRILAKPATQKNLHLAMMSYFAYPDLEGIVIQDPAFTTDLRNSMYREGELFLQHALWGGGMLSELLLSRKAFVNAGLAQLYGISTFPEPGTVLDADQFGAVTLPASRSGLVTQVAFLTTRSRPDSTSVVGRGLLIKKAFLCTDTPPPPDGLAGAIEEAEHMLAGASEREKSNYRTTTLPCSSCHLGFDAYGLALDTYDVIGRYRATDAQGRVIDPSVTLPEQVGGAMAKDAVEMAQKLVESGAFSKCMGTNLLNYALADVSAGAASLNSCAAAAIAQTFAGTDQTFASLIKAVATSSAFVNRAKGASSP